MVQQEFTEKELNFILEVFNFEVKDSEFENYNDEYQSSVLDVIKKLKKILKKRRKGRATVGS